VALERPVDAHLLAKQHLVLRVMRCVSGGFGCVVGTVVRWPGGIGSDSDTWQLTRMQPSVGSHVEVLQRDEGAAAVGKLDKAIAGARPRTLVLLVWVAVGARAVGGGVDRACCMLLLLLPLPLLLC
jgi:hypothetical protein